MAKYKLNDVEVKNIKFRRTVMDYLADVVNNDMGRYIYTDVRPRLGLKEDARLSITEDGEWIETEEENQLIKDVKKEVK